jgi:hypothetical protein
VAAGCVTVVWRVVVVDWVTGSSDAHEVSMTPATIENSEVTIVSPALSHSNGFPAPKAFGAGKPRLLWEAGSFPYS